MSDLILLGLGGAGCAMAQCLKRRLSAEAAAINTVVTPMQAGFDRQLILNTDAVEWPAVASAKHVEAALDGASGQLASLVDGRRHVVLMAGLGGLTGSIASMWLAQQCLASGASVSAVVTMPFEFERSRRVFAARKLAELEALPVRLVLHDHGTQLATHAGAGGLDLDGYLAKTAEILADKFCETIFS